MLNPRAKGQRIVLKAVRYATSFAGVVVIPFYQVSQWATVQPFDLIILRPTYWPRFVEVRSGQWRTGRASTVALAKLPGKGYHRQIWLLKDRETIPKIRQWDPSAFEGKGWWVLRENPWEGE